MSHKSYQMSRLFSGGYVRLYHLPFQMNEPAVRYKFRPSLYEVAPAACDSSFPISDSRNYLVLWKRSIYIINITPLGFMAFDNALLLALVFALTILLKPMVIKVSDR